MKLGGFHPEARAEYLAAIQYYNEIAPELGPGLLAEVEQAIEFAARMPLAGVLVMRNVRRLVLRRFPYLLRSKRPYGLMGMEPEKVGRKYLGILYRAISPELAS